VGANALTQTSDLGYGAATSAAGGYGLWPLTTTDIAGQTTSYTYDPLGRPTSQALPGERSGETTSATAHTVWCGTSMTAQAPCIKVDTTQRLDSVTTVLRRSFYDGWGHLIETRDQAPAGQDVVQYTAYNAQGQVTFTSDPYFVTAYAGRPSAGAFSSPDQSQAGMQAYIYDGLGRLLSSKNALSQPTTTSYTVGCGDILHDSDCYEITATVDALGHKSASFTDALGREDHTESFTGNSPRKPVSACNGKPPVWLGLSIIHII